MRAMLLAALARLRSDLEEAERSREMATKDPNRTDWELGWARGYAKGIKHAERVIVDFFDRFL